MFKDLAAAFKKGYIEAKDNRDVFPKSGSNDIVYTFAFDAGSSLYVFFQPFLEAYEHIRDK